MRRGTCRPTTCGSRRTRTSWRGAWVPGSDAAARAIDHIEKQVGAENLAAIIIEPIQGEGGFIVPAEGFLPTLAPWARENGVVFIADEVQAGFCRTGAWFASEHEGVVPDLITMAKGLTSAYVQLGALGMRRKYAEHFENNVFYGGLTYNSHPLGCATALHLCLRGLRPVLIEKDYAGRHASGVNAGGVLPDTFQPVPRDQWLSVEPASGPKGVAVGDGASLSRTR